MCERVALATVGRSPHLVAEMEHSLFVVGDHQWHRAYALVLLKEHVREPFDLPPDVAFHEKTISPEQALRLAALTRRSFV
jgi:hypothetical protein